MEQRYNIVRVKELTKGVESIVEVDWKNPEWVEGFFKIKKFFIGIETCNPPTFSKASSVFVLCITVALFFCRLRSFSFPEDTDVESTPLPDGEEGEIPYHPPEITTLYSVSARLEPLFLNANKRSVYFPNPASSYFLLFAWVGQQGDIAGRVGACVSLKETLNPKQLRESCW